jgi:hypothetical protein
MLKDKFKYDFELLDPQLLNAYYHQLCLIAANSGVLLPIFRPITKA